MPSCRGVIDLVAKIEPVRDLSWGARGGVPFRIAPALQELGADRRNHICCRCKPTSTARPAVVVAACSAFRKRPVLKRRRERPAFATTWAAYPGSAQIDATVEQGG